MVRITDDKKWILYTDPESGRLNRAICVDKIRHMDVYFDRHSFLEDRNKTVVWYDNEAYTVINVPLEDVVNLL